MITVNWTDGQCDAFSERRAELAVSAAAGSGKTAVLIERVRRAALGIVAGPDGKDINDAAQRVGLDRLLAVTFTRAAAAELRERLAEALAAAAAGTGSGVSPAVVREQLAALNRAQISTIHSFCGEVVRRYGHLRGISHGRILDEDEASLLRHDLATKYLDQRLGAGADPALRDLALTWGGADGVGPDDLSRMKSAGGLRQVLLGLLDFQRSLPDPDFWFERFRNRAELDPEHCDPQHPAVAALAAEFDEWVAEQTRLDQAVASALATDHPQAQFRVLAGRRRDQLDQLRFGLGWDRLAPFIETRLLGNKQADIKWKPELLSLYRRDIPKEDPWYHRTQAGRLKEGLLDWRDLFSTPWPEVARRENAGQRLTAALWDLTTGFGDHYSRYKRERGIADFDDMQRDALAVLVAADEESGRIQRGPDGRVLPSEAALELRRRFEMVLVDEHQDTNELQDTLIDLVTRDAPTGRGGGGRPRFFVGDLKQSIYTFRQAVPQLFSAARDRLDGADGATGRHIKLQTNFRSRPLVLTAINAIFDGLLTRELGGEEYTENRLLAPKSAEAAEDEYGAAQRARPAELHLIHGGQATGNAPAGDGDADAESPDRLEAAYTRLGLVLRGMHERGEVIRDRRTGFRPVQWRDMAVLMRSMANRVETLLSVFARLGIPAYAAGRSGFYERPEVADALSLLRIIDNPRQDIPLAAVLRGPAVGLCGTELLSVARAIEPEPGAPPADLWDRLLAYVSDNPGTGLADRLADFADRLGAWRDLARLSPVPELLWTVYADTGLPVAAAAQPGGEQRLANLYRLHDLARQSAGFERQGLARFLRTLELSRRAAGDLGEAPVLTEAQDVVRIMTVHQSKGLEFPVVAVPDLDKRFNLQNLGGDVLWHREAGVGGRVIDWHVPADPVSAPAEEYTPAERHSTLSRRGVKAALKAEAVAEELRVLYVALTRARERLILVGTLDRDKDGNLKPPKEGADAACCLDWVGARLAGGIAAAESSDTPVNCGPDGCWQVALYAPAARQPAVLRADAGEAVELTAQDQAVLRARLNPDYATPGSRLLPAKLTVTRLSHLPPAPDDADGVVATAEEAPDKAQAAAMPRFLQGDVARKLSPAEYGTAVHLLMSELDLGAGPDAERIGAVLGRLIDQGRLPEAAGQRIKPGHIALVAKAVGTLFDPQSAKLFPELPVAMLVPGNDGQLLEQLGNAGLQVPQPGAIHSDDRVYVQGVIDLLVIDGDTVTVIDYKTDRGADADELTRRYRLQLEWYCRMVQAMLPGKDIRWVIFGVDIAGIVGPVGYSEAPVDTA